MSKSKVTKLQVKVKVLSSKKKKKFKSQYKK